MPETRGVALGKPMDSLFGLDKASIGGDEAQETDDEEEEVTETSQLLRNEHRRTSIVAYT